MPHPESHNAKCENISTLFKVYKLQKVFSYNSFYKLTADWSSPQNLQNNWEFLAERRDFA
jgi:hypothetical protein